MNVLQNFVWGNKKKQEELVISNNFQSNIPISNKEFLAMDNMEFYLSGNINNILNNKLYRFVKVQIRQPEFYDGSACAGVIINNNVWIFVENANQEYKFFIGEKQGVFVLKLPQTVKIDRIYSVTGEHSTFGYGYGNGCMAPTSRLTYNIDALISYELIE